KRTNPVRNIDHVVHGAAGEEVLVAARESNDFVGEDGSNNEVDVGFCNKFVDLHVHVAVLQQTTSQSGNLSSFDGAEGNNGLWVVPIVVEHGCFGEALFDGSGRNTQELC